MTKLTEQKMDIQCWSKDVVFDTMQLNNKKIICGELKKQLYHH